LLSSLSSSLSSSSLSLEYWAPKPKTPTQKVEKDVADNAIEAIMNNSRNFS
jgi:hypothetical protein